MAIDFESVRGMTVPFARESSSRSSPPPAFDAGEHDWRARAVSDPFPQRPVEAHR